jgi:hypothetical protein
VPCPFGWRRRGPVITTTNFTNRNRPAGVCSVSPFNHAPSCGLDGSDGSNAWRPKRARAARWDRARLHGNGRVEPKFMLRSQRDHHHTRFMLCFIHPLAIAKPAFVFQEPGPDWLECGSSRQPSEPLRKTLRLPEGFYTNGSTIAAATPQPAAVVRSSAPNPTAPNKADASR